MAAIDYASAYKQYGDQRRAEDKQVAADKYKTWITDAYKQYGNDRRADDAKNASSSSRSSSRGSSYSGGGYSTPSVPYYNVPNMDFSMFDTLKNTANQSSETAKNSLLTSYNTLLRNLAAQNTEVGQSFNSGRQSISEDAYNNSRDNAMELSSRGLGASGLAQLGEVGERMAVGKQISSLAKNYYDAINGLAETEKQGTDSYQQGTSELQNQTQAQLDAIDYQKWTAQNAYNEALANADYTNRKNSYDAAQAAAAAARSQANWNASNSSSVSNYQAKLDAANKEVATTTDNATYVLNNALDNGLASQMPDYLAGDISDSDLTRLATATAASYVDADKISAAQAKTLVAAYVSKAKQEKNAQPKTKSLSQQWNDSLKGGFFDTDYRFGSNIMG